MRILIVTWHFPPYNTVAAIRLGKLARFLHRAGHQVQVITAARDHEDRSLPVEIPADQVIAVPAVDIDGFLDPATIIRRLLRSRPSATGPASSPTADPLPSARPRARLARLRQALSETYRCLIHLPDKQVGWTIRLTPALTAQLRRWRPDLIYVSGPPYSAFLSVRRAARRQGVPWVAEFRDLWADEAFPHNPAWRQAIDRWLEPWVLRGAAAIVSVSEPWTRLYASKYGRPALTIMNGFDPEDFRSECFGSDTISDQGAPLTVFHAGSIYRGRRDPSPVFRALRLGGFRPDQVRVVFYGSGLDWVADRVAAEGVADFVTLHPPIPYRQCLEQQRAADVLLLLQWDDPANVGNVPAKIFEYLALMRPVLVIGPEQGIPARLVRDRSAGLASSNPTEIAAQLRRWIDIKAQGGSLPPLPEAVHDGLSRDSQYALLERFLIDRVLATPDSGSTMRDPRPDA